jgi:hypothetical protein
LTVRFERIRLPRQSIHRIPRSTFVTMAKRPSCEHGTALDKAQFPIFGKTNIFATRA